MTLKGLALQAEVAWLLGQPTGLPAGVVEAWAEIEERAPADWVLTLRTLQVEERGERVLQGSSCLEVARAAALVLAFTIDPEAMVNRREQPSEPGPLASENQAVKGPARTEEPSRSPRRRAVHARRSGSDRRPPAPSRSPAGERPAFSVQGHGVAGIGLLPGMAWGVGGAATLRWRGLGLSAFGHYWFPRIQWAQGAEGKGGEFGSMGAGAKGFVTVLRSPVCIDALAGAELDRLRAEGKGVDEREIVKVTTLALVVGMSLVLPLNEHAFVGAGLELTLPQSRRRFVLDEIGQVYTSGSVNARSTLGGGWTF